MGLSEAAVAHRRLQAKEYYSRNREKYAEKQREWYQRNKEKRLEQTRKWQQENKERIREHRRANPEKYREKTKVWRANNRAKVLESSERCRIKKKYGITLEEYQERILAQAGRCEICLKVPDGRRSKRKLHLDHCHTTNKTRGMICGQCNTALGMVDDRLEILEAMICYLRKYRA